METKIRTDLKTELQRLKNSELHQYLSSLARQERKLTHQVLLCLSEVDRRKLYLEMAFPNLCTYLVEGIGYSPASAQRRIDAARLMIQVLSLGEKIESGAVNLSQVSLLQKTLRQVTKTTQTRLVPAEKKRLLEKLQNKSIRETELILSQEFCLPVVREEKQKIQRDESVRVELCFSKEQMEILEKAKLLLGHATPETGLMEVIVGLAERFVKQRTCARIKPEKKNSRQVNSEQTDRQNTFKQVTSAAEVTAHKTKGPMPVSTSVKKIILHRDQYCQFRDHKTGKICGSNRFLEIDHIQPRWAEGNNSPENLRILCRSHNSWRYQKGV